MNKKTVCLVIFISLVCFAQLAFGQGIQPPQGVPQDFGTLIANIAKAVGGLIASLGAAMVIVAGILYLTSAGSPERIATAKKALIYAIAGIAIGLAAGGIVTMVQCIMSGGGSC